MVIGAKDTRVGGCELYPHEVVERLKKAGSWGCDSVWVPESYFAEAYTFLSWIGANTRRMRLGTAVSPIQERTPVNCAQTAITLDHLTGGRVMVGLGVTGVNVAEGWYGQRFDHPLARTREYISVMREVLEGERPANENGVYYPLPVKGGVGSRKALKSPLRICLSCLARSARRIWPLRARSPTAGCRRFMFRSRRHNIESC